MILEMPISISLIQIFNFAFTIFNYYYLKIDNVFYLFAFMIYLGYISGSIYLNTFMIIT